MVKLKSKSTPSYGEKKKHNTKQMKTKVSPLLQGFIWGGCFTVTATISTFFGLTIGLKTPIDFTPFINTIQSLQKFGLDALFVPQLQKPTNILVMGIDGIENGEGNKLDRFGNRSDTMLLVRFQPDNHGRARPCIPSCFRCESGCRSSGADRI